MKIKKYISVLLAILLIGLTASPLFAQRERHRYRGGSGEGGTERMKIVCSFSDFAAIAEYITGSNANVRYIAAGEQDPHFVPPKPSFAMMLRDADMWITTGMDLEVWSTTLLDKARNRKIMDGEIGFVSVSDGVNVLQKVEKVDRTEGDIHLMGNPHINTGPLQWKVIAKNITIGLQKVNPDNGDYYISRRDEFVDRIDRSLFGDELVDMFGGETLGKMLENKTLFTFLERDYQGKKLIDMLGGWLKKALPFRGKKIMAYHKNWAYFIDTFGLEVVGYIEPKPGIPPSARHVQKMVKLIKDQDLRLMLVASYFEKKSPKMIEKKTGIKALFMPLYVGAAEGISDNFQMMDFWIDQVLANIK
ncbi:MAG: zinc ABC transporter substrate-binding protein [bacterium]|nr:zinc ABC transporter substrate-binding protein [bacterium]